MLLKMIWPALFSFILLIAESFVVGGKIITVHRLAEGNTVTETSILISESITIPLVIITILAVVIFTAMFITGIVWNIIYSMKQKDQ